MNTLKSLALLAILAPTLLLAEEENNIPLGEEQGTVETHGFIFDRYPPIYYSNAHHVLCGIGVLNNGEYTVELEDGSLWKISHYDTNKIVNWLNNTPLTVTQNNRWFSSHAYRLINKANGASVEATLYRGPMVNGPYSRFIIAIDSSKQIVFLNDNTQWEISYLDASVFKNWGINDYIVIGINSDISFWDSNKEALLINVNMNTFARAKQ